MVSSRALNPVLFVVGPTASGKSAFALELAHKLGGQIINADSRQFYRELYIGTSKPTSDELKQVQHHLVDCASIAQGWHVGDFCTAAREAIAVIQSQNKPVLVVGGTGLYVHSLLYGLDSIPPVPQDLRDKITQRHRENGIAPLYQELCELDPESQKRLKPNDTQRILRALEVMLHTGKPISTFWVTEKKPLLDFVMVAPELDRQTLYHRINERVLKMVTGGLKDEVQNLWRTHPENRVLKSTIGYQEWMETGFQDDAAVALIQKNSRQFAKRQITWFRREKGVEWIKLGAKSMTDLGARLG